MRVVNVPVNALRCDLNGLAARKGVSTGVSSESNATTHNPKPLPRNVIAPMSTIASAST